MDKIMKFVVSLAICFSASIANTFFTRIATNTWYAQLIKPDLVPPNWLLSPVWTALHFLMAIALYIVWASNEETGKFLAISAFAYQLFINIAWSALFFQFHFLRASFYIIIILLVASLITICLFALVKKRTVYLLLPYFCWMCFAAYLNYHIWLLNK